MYEQGKGREQDAAAMLRWYRESARRGNRDAQVALARLRDNESRAGLRRAY